MQGRRFPAGCRTTTSNQGTAMETHSLLYCLNNTCRGTKALHCMQIMRYTLTLTRRFIARKFNHTSWNNSSDEFPLYPYVYSMKAPSATILTPFSGPDITSFLRQPSAEIDLESSEKDKHPKETRWMRIFYSKAPPPRS
jgi:hypothetical protein